MSSSPDTYWFTVDQVGDVTVVRFKRSRFVKDGTAEEVGDQLYGLVDQGRRRLLLDFRMVERLYSEMIGKLLALNKKLQAAGGRLAFCHLQPDVQDIFETARLTKVLPIYAEEAEALQSFLPSPAPIPGKQTGSPSS